MQASSNKKRRLCISCKKKRLCNRFSSDSISSCMKCVGTPIVKPIVNVQLHHDKYELLLYQLRDFQRRSSPSKMFWHFFDLEEIETMRCDISKKRSKWEPINFDGNSGR